jgi:pSer/pThr/pTyr-binding forkhead associated (FHA) protein
MFGLGEREAAEMAGARSWVLTATDSNGGVVTTRITEEALRRSHGGLVIGRDEAQSDVTIPDHTVSRRHAVLALAAEGLVIEDVNSRNGTWVDGVPLTPSRRVMVAGSSTRITLGCVNLVISEERDV